MADNSAIPTDGIPVVSYDRNTNRITNSGFQYDYNGNQTRALAPDGVTWLKYEYDAANRVQLIKKDDGTYLQAFQYGSTNAKLMDMDYAFGYLKLFASGGAVEYTEFAGATPSWTKSYTYLGDSVLSTESKNGTSQVVEYNHPDRLGTKTVTNQQVGTSYEQNSLPFGTTISGETTATSLNKKFTSYERSSSTGLDYAINRTYDSKQGRFTQVDPIGMSASSLGSPQTLNLYTYCGNDPINHTDPNGLFWGFIKKLFRWALVVVAVIVAVLTIIAAPPTFVGILGAISAGAGAASQVLNALGYRKAGLIVGLIATITGFGSIIAAKTGVGSFASEGGKIDLSGAWFGVLTGVGAIVNYFAQTDGKKRKNKGFGSPFEIRRTFFRKFGKKYNDCLKKVFGADYSKIVSQIGVQNLANSPVIDFTKNMTQVGAISSVPAAVGSSDFSYGKNGKVYVASEIYQSTGANVRNAVFGTFAHEAANVLDIKINQNSPNRGYTYGNPNDPDDRDTGAAVERCLFNGQLQYP